MTQILNCSPVSQEEQCLGWEARLSRRVEKEKCHYVIGEAAERLGGRCLGGGAFVLVAFVRAHLCLSECILPSENWSPAVAKDTWVVRGRHCLYDPKKYTGYTTFLIFNPGKYILESTGFHGFPQNVQMATMTPARIDLQNHLASCRVHM